VLLGAPDLARQLGPVLTGSARVQPDHRTQQAAPQLLAAASAPATAAELRGESAARLTFRSSQHTAPLPHDVQRRSRVHTTSAIVITKAIAAIALTASAVGGVALATTATPADPQAHTARESSATGDAAPSHLVAPPAGPDEASGSRSTEPGPDDSDTAAAVPTAIASGPEGGAGSAARPTPEARAPHPTGRCRAASNISAEDQTGNAAESPAFAGLSCTDAAAGTGTRPTGRRAAAPGDAGEPDTH